MNPTKSPSEGNRNSNRTPGITAKVPKIMPWVIAALLGLANLYLGFGWWDACLRQASLQNQLELLELKKRDVEQQLAAEKIIGKQQAIELKKAEAMMQKGN